MMLKLYTSVPVLKTAWQVYSKYLHFLLFQQDIILNLHTFTKKNNLIHNYKYGWNAVSALSLGAWTHFRRIP